MASDSEPVIKKVKFNEPDQTEPDPEEFLQENSNKHENPPTDENQNQVKSDPEIEEEEDNLNDSNDSVKPQKIIPQVCPYLDTVDRPILDFDFEKVCSISLSRNNVYMCLICGKYFQGRGEKTHAFTHSLVSNHHVFLCLRFGV